MDHTAKQQGKNMQIVVVTESVKNSKVQMVQKCVGTELVCYR